MVVGTALAAAVLVLKPPVRTPPSTSARGDGSRVHAAPRLLSAVLLDVAAQLSSGADVTTAWGRVLPDGARRLGAVGQPTVDQLLAVTTDDRARFGGRAPRPVRRAGVRAARSPAPVGRSSPVLSATGRTRGPAAVARGRAASVVVAVTAAGELGAPLVDVLHRMAAALAAEEESAAEVRAAVAGPRATARVLALLPLLGLAVATLLGAHPVAVMLGGGLGTATAVLGLGLLLAGRSWTRRLLVRASGGT